MFQAELELIVDAPAENKFCLKAPGCQKKEYPGAWHEILMEKDSIRNDAMARVVRYFDAFSGGR
jgi:alpha-beta hydrolase superfamily lysophospholipase